MIITSPAFRALETAYIFAEAAGINPESVIINSNLYYKANLNLLLRIIGELDEKITTITLFGHNPAFTELPDRLSKNGCEFVTKTSVVGISFNVKTWAEVKTGQGQIDYFLKPEKAL